MTSAPPAFAAAHAAGTWVFRALDAVYACAPGAAGPAWKVSLGPEAMGLGSTPIVAAGDVAVTVVGGGFDTPARVVAVSAKDGSAAWEREVALRPDAYGLAAVGDAVFLHGTDPELEGRLVVLRGTDGSVAHETRTEDAPGIRVAAGNVFIMSPAGIFRVDGDGGAPVQVSPLAAFVSAADSASLYAYVPHGEGLDTPAVIRFDGATGKESARVPVPAESLGRITGLYAAGVEGQVLLAGESGAQVVDTDAGRLGPKLQMPAGKMAGDAVGTPHGIGVLQYDASMKGDAAVYDVTTGEGQALETRALAPEGIFYLAGRLIVSAGGLNFFSWKR